MESRRRASTPVPAVSSIQATPADPPVVETDAGPVTLEELPALSSRQSELAQKAKDLAEQARSLRSLAEDRLVDLGSLLLDSPQWAPPADMDQLAAECRTLRTRVGEEQSQLDSLRTEERHGLGGMIGRVGAWNQSRRIERERVSVESQLRQRLLQLAQLAPRLDFDAGQKLQHQADSATSQAQELETQSSAIAAAAQKLAAEIKSRTDAQSEMGFDAPYLTAYLKTYGPAAVTSPLNLKRGETALAVLSARLARQQTRTHYVGGSQGFSFPIGHTGIRYRVGSYHGHPVQQQLLATLDSGSLVITDQRIAFIGATKATSIPLSKIVHVQCYSDGLAVFQEGHENPDFYLTSQPKYALFMLNWAESHSA